MADVPPLDDSEREELIAFLDGELAHPEAQHVEKKLNTDPRYRAEADALRRTWNLLDFLPRPDPSPSFTHRTISQAVLHPAATGAGRNSRRRLAAGWAAAVLVAAATGFFAAGFSHRSRPDLTPEQEQVLGRDLRLIENLGLYQHVPDLQFLNELDRPELFGEDLGY
jgi:anti-sigma factor RsiW